MVEKTAYVRIHTRETRQGVTLDKLHIPSRDLSGRLVGGAVVLLGISLAFVPARDFSSWSSFLNRTTGPFGNITSSWVFGIIFLAVALTAAYLIGTATQRYTFAVHDKISKWVFENYVEKQDPSEEPSKRVKHLIEYFTTIDQLDEVQIEKILPCLTEQITDPLVATLPSFTRGKYSLCFICKRYILLCSPDLYRELESVETNLNLYTAFTVPLLFLGIVMIVKTLQAFTPVTLLAAILALLSCMLFTAKFCKERGTEAEKILKDFIILKAVREKRL